MGVVDDFKGTTIFCKVAFILLFIATLFTCISYTTTEWVYDDIGADALHYGLWRICGEAELPGACSHIDGWANDWYGVVQAFVTFGFFGILISFFLVVLYIFVGKCQKNGEVAIAVAIICIATGVFYLIGIIIFGAKVNDKWVENAVTDYKFGYSFALSIIAFLLEIVAGVMMLVEGKGGVGGGRGTKPLA
ncbi:voltage-dependent calcium channel gamma-5 subunit-like [Mytilus galloprovincialis]|uniref:voltage-dependent calcium channel gamma-5 subunit-like n=1 Tax=Mytilus galloprovincialis TaxID=29158 RepID=UPI003F7CAAE2